MHLRTIHQNVNFSKFGQRSSNCLGHRVVLCGEVHVMRVTTELIVTLKLYLSDIHLQREALLSCLFSQPCCRLQCNQKEWSRNVHWLFIHKRSASTRNVSSVSGENDKVHIPLACKTFLTSFSLLIFLLAMAMSHLCLMKISAILNPIPDPPPVMRATLPRRMSGL